MNYTISQAANRIGIPDSTLRYYDKEGLLPSVKRVSGRRVFCDADFEWLELIDCLKSTGMHIKDIREFIALCAQGDSSLEDRLAIILRQKDAVHQKISFLKENLQHLEYKAWYYQTALEAGTEKVHEGDRAPSFSTERI